MKKICPALINVKFKCLFISDCDGNKQSISLSGPLLFISLPVLYTGQLFYFIFYVILRRYTVGYSSSRTIHSLVILFYFLCKITQVHRTLFLYPVLNIVQLFYFTFNVILRRYTFIVLDMNEFTPILPNFSHF